MFSLLVPWAFPLILVEKIGAVFSIFNMPLEVGLLVVCYKVFPEFVQEAKYKKDDLVLCNIPFSPGQVVHGHAQKCIDWVKDLEHLEDALKPHFKKPIKGKRRTKDMARPVMARLLSRESTGSSACQSPLQNLPTFVFGLNQFSFHKRKK